MPPTESHSRTILRKLEVALMLCDAAQTLWQPARSKAEPPRLTQWETAVAQEAVRLTQQRAALTALIQKWKARPQLCGRISRIRPCKQAGEMKLQAVTCETAYTNASLDSLFSVRGQALRGLLRESVAE